MGIPIIGDLIEGVKDIVSEVVVDKDKRDQVNLELKRLEDQAQARLDNQVSSQIDVNKIEAAHSSVFVAGWRPFIGWVGGAGLGMQAIVLPLASQFTGRTYDLNTELLMMTISSILGIGGMRTYEKVKGVASNDYSVQPQVPTTPTKVTVDPSTGTVEVKAPAQAPTPVVTSKKKWSF